MARGAHGVGETGVVHACVFAPEMGRKEGLLFLKKKKQKDFYEFSTGRSDIPALKEQKFFAPLFFKKAAACFLPFAATGGGACRGFRAAALDAVSAA
jgi:hypothetical protein